MKRCIKCGIEKPLDQFYAHSAMKDGRLNKCIQCTKTEVRERAAVKALDPEWVKSERARHREKFKKYYASGLAKQSANEVKKRWVERNRQKRIAHLAVARALITGRLQRPKLCEVCGVAAELEGHHDDYSKPLAVRWLCNPCHGKTRHLDT
jgi:hypothetical protein